jgi:uncharacterized membrane protein
MSAYLWIKALHVTAMVVWLATMLMTPPLLRSLNRAGAGADGLRRIWSRAGTPAMPCTLALGITLAQQAGWFAAEWLQAKLILVFLLAGLHGVIAGHLRRAVFDRAYVCPAWVGRLYVPVATILLAIAVLAIVKPN